MVLRLHRPRHRAEHVFHRRRQGHHAVAFQLAEVDDSVGLVQIGGVLKGLRRNGLGKMGGLLLEIPVQPPAEFLHGSHAGGGVHPIHIGGGI